MTRSYAIETEGEAVKSKRKETAIYTVMLFNDFHLRMTKHQSPVATYLLNNDSIDATKVSFDSAFVQRVGVDRFISMDLIKQIAT